MPNLRESVRWRGWPLRRKPQPPPPPQLPPTMPTVLLTLPNLSVKWLSLPTNECFGDVVCIFEEEETATKHRVSLSLNNVTLLECALSCTVWCTMLVYYPEAPYGQLIDVPLGKQEVRTQVRGNLFSFSMPLDYIANILLKSCATAVIQVATTA